MTLSLTLKRMNSRLPGWQLRRTLAAQIVRAPGVPLWMKAMPHTWLSLPRLRALIDHAETVTATNIPGAFLECGVAEGGSALLLAKLRTRLDPKREVWLFDTFEGLPPPTADDPDYDKAVKWIGLCRGELTQVQRLLTSHGERDVRYVKGLYEVTMASGPLPEQIAVLYLDSDWYEPTMTCLQYLWPRVSPGGRVQFDDYGTWEGCRKAVHEFFGPDFKVHKIDLGGAWIEKPR